MLICYTLTLPLKNPKIYYLHTMKNISKCHSQLKPFLTLIFSITYLIIICIVFPMNLFKLIFKIMLFKSKNVSKRRNKTSKIVLFLENYFQSVCCCLTRSCRVVLCVILIFSLQRTTKTTGWHYLTFNLDFLSK